MDQDEGGALVIIPARLAKIDAVIDFEIDCMDGARSSWIKRHRERPDAEFAQYLHTYEDVMQALCDGERARQRRQMGGGR